MNKITQRTINMWTEEDRKFHAGALLVLAGALLALASRLTGPAGAVSVTLRGLELMDVPAPKSAEASDYVQAAAAAIMARWA
jgi:hypothetical protein